MENIPLREITPNLNLYEEVCKLEEFRILMQIVNQLNEMTELLNRFKIKYK